MFVRLSRRITRRHTICLLLIFANAILISMGIHHLANVLMTKFGNSAAASFNSRSKAGGPTVIVAHYIGSGNFNLSKDVLNQNFFSPISGEGDNGRAVIVPARDILKMQHLFQINRFNVLASDRIPLNRTLPDVRKQECLLVSYARRLPTTSVIIIFHNEAWSVLLRTVWSIINRSPHHLLKEILLVDDASNRTYLKQPLDDYVATLPVPTKVLRQPIREGLVPARLMGADYATGEVLTFLDAHCECTVGWLEPLLARVQKHPTHVVSPVIDIISDDNFGYVKSFELHWGAFNWEMHFRWYLMGERELNKRKKNVIQPFATPAMAGGLFSVDRNYFFRMGSYDEKMKIWGGDNLEMSFRIWQCGGRVEIAPCSHVGHLFRKSSPYTFPGGVSEILNENLARTALVWMDDWAQFFFKYHGIAETQIANYDVSERKRLRSALKCKSFDWYLQNVWIENFLPAHDRFFGKLVLAGPASELLDTYLRVLRKFDMSSNGNWTYTIKFLKDHLFRLQYLLKPQSAFGFCLQKPLSQGGVQATPYGQAGLQLCHRNDSANLDELFVIKANGNIMTNEGICLDASIDDERRNGSTVQIVTCARTLRQRWQYNALTQQIEHKPPFCLTGGSDQLMQQFKSGRPDTVATRFNLTITKCSVSNGLQRWVLLPLQWTRTNGNG